MEYFKSAELGYEAFVFVRHHSEAKAQKLFELFKRVHPSPAKGPLMRVSWWKGWNAFRGVPSDHKVTWEEFEGGTEFGKYSASRSDLFA